MKKSVLIAFLKYGVGLGLLAFVIWRNWAPAGQEGLSAIWHRYVIEGQPINYGALALAVGICLASVLLTFVRWYVLVRAQALPFTLTDAMRLGMVGYFLSNLLPAGSVGGDIFKAAFLAREQSRRAVAVATVLVDRVIGLWGLFWLVALVGGAAWAGGWLGGEGAGFLKTVVVSAGGLVGASILGWLVLGILPGWRAERFAGRLGRIPKVGHTLAELWRAVWMYRCQGGSVALALLMTLVGHVGFVLTFYFSARTLLPADQIPTIAEHFVIVPIGMVVQAGIPTPGGIGGAEVCFQGLYYLINPLFKANGLLGSMMQRVITWGLSLAGYLVYLRMRPGLATQQAGEAAEDERANEEGSEDMEVAVESQAQPQLLPEP